jgi:hypothetical protein
MTPKEKAQEIFDKYYIVCQEYTEEIQCSIQAKQCTLIAVNEIQKIKSVYHDEELYDYFQQVKYETNNI